MAESTAVMSLSALDELTLTEISRQCCLPVARIEDVYECTPMQMSVIAESAINASSGPWRFVVSIGPSINQDHLCDVLRNVVERNTTLRTRFVVCRRGVLQAVTNVPHCTRRGEADSGISMPMGQALFRSAISDKKLVLDMHHGIMDSTAVVSFITEIFLIYYGRQVPGRVPFKDFVAYCRSIDQTAAKSFWASRFQGAPTVFPRVPVGHVPSATERLSKKVSWGRGSKETCISIAHAAPYLETAWALTLASYANSDNIAFGLVLSGRKHDIGGLEISLGPSMAIIPVQVVMTNSASIRDVLKKRSTALREAQNSPALHYGTVNIRKISEAARAASEFQSILNIRPHMANPMETNDEVSWDHSSEPSLGYCLSISCDVTDEGFHFHALADPGILCRSQLQRILDQFEHNVHSLTEVCLDTAIGQLPVLNENDHAKILDWNSNVPDAVERCVHDIFHSQARQNPDAVAVDASDGAASYFELDLASSVLAQELRQKGISGGSPVAFLFRKSLWAIVALLAILKAGGVCVPLDTRHPRARKKYIISTVGAKLLLVSSEERDCCTDLCSTILAVDGDLMNSLPRIKDFSADQSASSGGLAYIMFTSGSTGNPKGVMLEHQNFVSVLSTAAPRLGLSPNTRVLQFASYVWDASILEVLSALMFGGCLCIPSENDRDTALSTYIEAKRVNWALLTPAVLRTLSPRDIPGLKTLTTGGDAIAADTAGTWGRDRRLINLWGPSEISIFGTAGELTPHSPHPETIGTPIGSAVWITRLGNPNQLLPIGAIGEILVEGPGVARGYLDDEVKTKASFLPPPSWAPDRGGKTRHFYRTGDLARYNSDGSICFMGRQDNQVKVRGQRFELGELESVLCDIRKVDSVMATTKIVDGRTQVIAILSLADPSFPREKVLQELTDTHAEMASRHLATIRRDAIHLLPSYMVPTLWIPVERLPFQASTKLDRAAVREWLKTKNMSAAKIASDARKDIALTPPKTDEEKLLQITWASVLNVSEKEIGLESSFIELGGDSISAMEVASRCRQEGLQLTTATLLASASLSVVAESSTSLDDALGQMAATPQTPPQAMFETASLFEKLKIRDRPLGAQLRADNVEAIVPATDMQTAMLALGEMGGKAYHASFAINLAPPLDTHRLRIACEDVFLNHAILRTVFVRHGSGFHQFVYRNLPNGAVTEKRSPSESAIRFREGQTLAQFKLLVDEAKCHRLTLDIHHALYDAISMGIILQDLVSAYNRTPLSQGPQFYSWVSHMQSVDVSESRKYWTERLRGSSMKYLAPHPREPIRGCTLDQNVSVSVPLEIMKIPLTTQFTALKAAWALVLSSALHMDDVVFGEVTANRHMATFPNVNQVRGPCINCIPARANFDGTDSIGSLITQIQEEYMNSLSHHCLDSSSIIKDCAGWSTGTRFNSALVYQNHVAVGHSITIGGSDYALSMQGKIGESADIWVMAFPGTTDLDIKLWYSAETFDEKQINWISKALERVLLYLPMALEQEIDQLRYTLWGEIGSYVAPSSRSTFQAKTLGDRESASSDEARTLVSRAWEEVDVKPQDDYEDVSIFTEGNLVTALLLSEYYRSHGVDINTADLVRYPTWSMQAQLVDSKRRGGPGNDGVGLGLMI